MSRLAGNICESLSGMKRNNIKDKSNQSFLSHGMKISHARKIRSIYQSKHYTLSDDIRILSSFRNLIV